MAKCSIETAEALHELLIFYREGHVTYNLKLKIHQTNFEGILQIVGALACYQVPEICKNKSHSKPIMKYKIKQNKVYYFIMD